MTKRVALIAIIVAFLAGCLVTGAITAMSGPTIDDCMVKVLHDLGGTIAAEVCSQRHPGERSKVELFRMLLRQ